MDRKQEAGSRKQDLVSGFYFLTSLFVRSFLVLKVIGKGGVEVTVEGILDTDFDGFLCLPIPLAVSLGLELIDVTRTELADGTIVEDELVFAGRAEWDGTVVMDVDILLTRSGGVLIGTAFLKGYLVQLDYKANTIRIEKAPS